VVIDCRTEHDSYFPDPDDCHMFYHCSDWAGLEHKSCGSLFFHPQKRVCDWPNIVRRVRYDCRTDKEIEEIRVETSVNAGSDEEGGFDDGSFFTFQPERQNRFRLATPKPRQPSRSEQITSPLSISSTSSKPVRFFEVQPVFNPSTARQPLREEFTLVRSEERRPEVEQVKRPRVLQVVQESSPVVVKSMPPRHIAKAAPTRSQNGPSTIRQIERTPVTVVKTLPSRNIVKSLPIKRPSTTTTTTTTDSLTTSRRPIVVPTNRARKPLKVPSSHRFSVPKQRFTTDTTTATEDSVRSSGTGCRNGRCFSQSRRTQIRLNEDQDDAEELFHTIKKATLNKEQVKIQNLLEQAKVDEPLEFEVDTEEPEPLTTPSGKEIEEETTTTFSDLKVGSLPFKTPEERPDFLDVVKKKAKKFNEILKGIKQNASLYKDAEELAEVVTITVVTSTSSTLSKAKGEKMDNKTKLALTSTSTLKTTEETTEPSKTETTVVEISVPTTTVETTTGEDEEDDDAAEDVTQGVVLSDVEFGNNDEGDEKEEKNLSEEDDDATVFVVQAVSAEPKAEPLVDSSDQEKTEKDEVGGNALQESRIHETITSNHNHSHRKEKMIGKPSSVDMFMSLMEHLDLGAIMHHMSGEDENKEETTTTTTTTASFYPTTTTRRKELEVRLVRKDKSTTTTTETPSSIPGTEEQQDFTVHTAVPPTEEEEEAEERESTTTEASTTTATTTQEENVHVVLPVGWTTKSDRPAPKRTTNAPSARKHPLSTFKTTTTRISMATPTTATEEPEEFSTTTRSSNLASIRPFTSDRDRIRQRFRSSDRSSSESTLDVLEAINSKTLADAKAARERDTNAREEARKTLAARESLQDKQKITTTEAPDVSEKETPNDDVEDSTSQVDVGSLVDRRNQLFSRRTSTRRSRTQPVTKASVLSAEQAKKQQILEEIRRNKKNPQRPKSLLKKRPSASGLFRQPSSISSLSVRLQGQRRPKTAEDIARSSSSKKRQVEVKAEQASSILSSAEQSRKNLRCKLFRNSC
jgi:hypothetical protein